MKTYGGQAVMEGVMMRGQRHVAVAVRAPAGDIVVHEEVLNGGLYRSRWARLPLIRGAVAIWDTMVLGTRTLLFSANVAMAESGEAAQKTQMPQGVLWGTIIFALGGAMGLFFALPVLLTGVVDQYHSSSILSNFVEKMIRLALILGYMVAIGRLPDIQRVFAYHGAEHKAINAFEAGVELTPENVKRFSLIHPRCGTTFLLIVVIISFILFSLLGQPPLPLRILSRIIFIPIVAGIAYEFIRFTAKHYQTSGLIRALMAPGLAAQRLTTREPDLEMCAVAIAALKPVIAAEEAETAFVPAAGPAGAAAVEPALSGFGARGVPATSASAE